jgi:hypothetical protein
MPVKRIYGIIDDSPLRFGVLLAINECERSKTEADACIKCGTRFSRRYRVAFVRFKTRKLEEIVSQLTSAMNILPS